MACGICASTRNRVTTCVKCCAAAPQRMRSNLRLSRCGKGAATAERKTAKPWAHAALWSPSSNSARIPTSKCIPAEDNAGILSRTLTSWKMPFAALKKATSLPLGHTLGSFEAHNPARGPPAPAGPPQTPGSVWANAIPARQWAAVARIVQGHRLVTEGPYSLVRNPIHLAMFGMLLATELVWSRWWVTLVAVSLFLAGNEIRIRNEEEILRETFGERFEEYARRVLAFFPHLF